MGSLWFRDADRHLLLPNNQLTLLSARLSGGANYGLSIRPKDVDVEPQTAADAAATTGRHVLRTAMPAVWLNRPRAQFGEPNGEMAPPADEVNLNGDRHRPPRRETASPR
jgi:hypothetical protein